ncbi:MAG: hypothetical protein R3E82_12460 [Pseudomonadales bacterium]
MVNSLLKPPTRGRARGRQLTRTILLAALAVVVGIYWLADSFGVDQAELLGYLQVSALFVGAFMLAGVLAGGLFWLLRRAWNRRR